MAIGPNVRYPTLQGIADLFRFLINDTANNTTGSGTGSGTQAGLIMPNSNPDLLTLLNEGISETYSDLRNIGDQELILDNYLVIGLPALAAPDPTVQVSLDSIGFFNGQTFNSNFTLPANCTQVLRLWERQSGTGNSFVPMNPAPFGLGGIYQGNLMSVWEMRQNAIWMPGALVSIDLRIRCRIAVPDYLNPATIDFTTAYVPIISSKNAIAAKMRVQYATRFAPEQYPMAIQEEVRLMDKLKLEVVRQMQATENQRTEFGDEAVQDFAVAWSWL
jgi:hypothetical protein